MEEFRKTTAEKLLLVICALLVLAQILLVAIYYSSLPDTIPIHYGINGEADAFGPRYTLWILVGISTAVFALLFFLQNKGNKISINWPLKEENKEAVQIFSLRWMRLIMLNIAWFLFYLVLGTILITLGYSKKLSVLIILLFVLVNLVLVFGGIMRMQEINAGRNRHRA